MPISACGRLCSAKPLLLARRRLVKGNDCVLVTIIADKSMELILPHCSLCYLKEGPCGGVPSGAPATSLTAGQEYAIAFQQNLNHFYVENPGRLVADFAEKVDPEEADFTPLGSPVADYNAVSVNAVVRCDQYHA